MTTDLTILLIDDPGSDWDRVTRAVGTRAATVVNFMPATSELKCPESWTVRDALSWLNVDDLRRDFFNFLERMPLWPLSEGKTLDDVLRRPEGYSIWWTSVGTERHPDREPFLSIRALWLCDRIMRQHPQTPILIYSRRPAIVAAIVVRCRREGRSCQLAPGCSAAAADPWDGRGRWWLDTLKWMLVTPFVQLARSAICRWMAPPAHESAAEREIPAILYSGAFPLDISIENERMSLCWWRELVDAVAHRAPAVRHRYLLETMTGKYKGYRSVSNWYHTGWPILRRRPEVAPTQDRYAALGAWLAALPRQVALMRRWAKLERDDSFRQAFTLAGMNVAPLYVPRIRRAIARLAGWSRSVAAIVKSLRAVGNVRAFVLVDEVYERGMLNVAAARKIGIPTIGMQHGTIFPLHMIYTLPPGQVEGAPTPSAFAVYGDYSKDILSKVGSVSYESVWQTGSPRFDPLVEAPPDRTAARDQLDLPQAQRIILLATQFYPWFPRAATALFRAVAGRNDCLVCVKTHPKDVPIATYQQLATQAGATNVRFFDDRFDDLLAACDVLVSGSSTTVFEAILLGRDTICVNFSGEPDRYPYVEDGGSLSAQSDEEMNQAIERTLSGDAAASLRTGRERFIARHAAPCAEAHSADRLAARLLELIGG